MMARAGSKRLAELGVASLLAAASVVAGPSTDAKVSAVSGAVVSAPGGVANGLVLWLDASNPSGNGTTPTAGTLITTWEDLSTANNDATVNPNGVVQSNTAAAWEAAPTGFNGNPALRFTRIDDNSGSVYQTANLDIRAGTVPDVTVVAVYRPTKKDGVNGIWGIDNDEWDRFFLSHIPFSPFNGNGLVALGPQSPGNGEQVPGAADTDKTHLMVVGYGGDVVNGVNVGDPGQSYVEYNCSRSKTFTDTTHPTDAQQTLSVGWDGNTSAFDGYIAEMVVYNRTLTTVELADVNRYLATKYGLGSGCASFATPSATVTAPSGSMTIGDTPPTLGSASVVDTKTLTALTFDTWPTCDVYASATDEVPITLSPTTPAGSYITKCSGGTVTGFNLDTYVNGTFTVNRESLHVCVDKLYVVYGAGYYTPKVYYCVPDLVCAAPSNVDPTDVAGLSDECDDDPTPTLDFTDGYSTVSGGTVLESGVVADLVEPVVADNDPIIEDPVMPMHYEHGIPDGWRKVNPSEYPDTTPPICDSDYEQGDEVSDSPMPITCVGGDPGPYEFDYSFVEEMNIEPAELKVKPKHLKISYNDPVPSYEYTIKGFKLGDDADDLVTKPNCGSSYAPGADAGSKFDIICSGGVDENYNFRYQRSHVHVERLKVRLSASDRSVKYGDPAPAYTWSVDGLVSSDQEASAQQLQGYVAPVCGAAYTPTTSAGTYPIVCTGGGSTNYEFVVQRGTLTVHKAPLKVTPLAATVVYGGTSPTAGMIVSGFLGGQTASTASGYEAPKCTAAGYTTATNAGSTLPITCTGGSATNYTFEQVGSANLTVTKAPAIVRATATTVTYGSAPGPYGYMVSGLLNGQTAAGIDGLVAPVCTSPYTALTAVGSTPMITCTGAMSTNYSFSYVAAKMTVGKATLTVTPINLSVAKGSVVPAYTFTVTGFPNGTGPVGSYTAPKCTSGYNKRSAIGTYTITCSGGFATNYSFVYRTASLAVR